jgi:xanthine/CO dehydrogenase XdhC/CoxF family maturation factor
MTDLERILPLWRDLETAQADFVLATVVAVEGSSYRKPGACMLLAPDGRRAGTVSGGCLEAQVASRAWWLTSNGPTVQRYSTVEEDGDLPYGSGCGGVVYLLLERRPTAGPLLAALQEAFDRRIPFAVATILEGEQIGRREFSGLERVSKASSSQRVSAHDRVPSGCRAEAESRNGTLAPEGSQGEFSRTSNYAQLGDLAGIALASNESLEKRILIDGSELRVWGNFRPARPGLWIFGAGDDAKPLLNLAKELGWFVSVADGRSHLATRERFPLADEVGILQIQELPENKSALSESAFAHLQPQDAAVILTHSFEQDSRILASLLAMDKKLAYIGVLGPQRRTRELLVEVARLLKLPSAPASAATAWIERRLSELHAPMGLDLGAESPETIAFSIVAEIQQSFTAATAHPLREVRNAAQAIHG